MLPSADEILERAHVVALPMAVKFRGITTREALLIDGPAGWGEFSPFVEYGPQESAAWLRAGLEAAYEGFPDPVRDSIEVNATIPAVPASEVPAVVERYPGCRTFKIKVAEKGQALDDDVARVAAVRDGLGPEGRVRLDANGGWGVDDAVAAITRLAAFDLEYVEQPVMPVEDLAVVRRRVEVPIAADESAPNMGEAAREILTGGANLLCVKTARTGFTESAKIVGFAQAAGVDVYVGNQIDTQIGSVASVVFGAAFEHTHRRAGELSNYLDMADDLIARPLTIADGKIMVPDVPGVGTEPDLEKLAAHRDR